jgi:preprotein translocase subunit SecA
MAGRGTDIRISSEAAELGGLIVIGAGRSTDRREDEHLRGRAARHGLPGTSVFLLSLEDELMKMLTGPWLRDVLHVLGMRPGETIESPLLTRRIRSAQLTVKAALRARRRRSAMFGDAVERQRRTIYGLIKHFALCADPVNETRGILQFAVQRWLDQAGPLDLRGYVRRAAIERVRDYTRFLVDASGLMFEGELIGAEEFGRRLFESVWNSLMLDEICRDTAGIDVWRQVVLDELRESWKSYFQATSQRFEKQRVQAESVDLLLAQYLDWCDQEFHRVLACCGERCLSSIQDLGQSLRNKRTRGGGER